MCASSGPGTESPATARSQDRRQLDGLDIVHAIVDDHSRLAYAEIHEDQKAVTVVGFLERALAFYASHGITPKRLMTDNGWQYARSRDLRRLLERHRHPAPQNQALPTPHQRQGRALPPDDGPRMGIRARLQLTPRPRRRSATLAPPLQHTAATQLDRRPTPDQPHSQRVWVGQLIWSEVCQVRHGLKARCLRAFLFRRGERSGRCRRGVTADMRGSGPHDRVCELRSGAALEGRASPGWAARSCTAGRSSRRCAGALSSPGRCGSRLLHRRERPAVAGELARDGDRDDRAPLAASFERFPALVRRRRARVGARAAAAGWPAGAARARARAERLDAAARRPRPAAGARACCRSW